MDHKTISSETMIESNDCWISAYIFHQLSFEQLIAECLYPLLESMRHDDRINNCFFIRYWEGGTHLRLRIQLKNGNLRTELEALIQQEFKSYFGQMKQKAKKSRLDFVPYLPEYQRYGGQAFIEPAERHFGHSSKVIAKLIRENYSQWDYSLALGFALQMNIVFAKAFFDNAHLASSFFKHFFQNWLPYSIKQDTAGRFTQEEVIRVTQFFQASYQQQKTRILQLIQITQSQSLVSLECRPEEWHSACLELRSNLQQMRKLIDLSAPPWFVYQPNSKIDHSTQMTWSVYESYIHMTHNRLGIYLRDEAFLAYLLYQGFQEVFVAEAGL